MQEVLLNWCKCTKDSVYQGLLSIREAFICLIPVVIFFNLMVLVILAFKALADVSIVNLPMLNAETYLKFNTYLFPMFFMLALSVILAAKHNLDKISVVILTFSSAVVFSDHAVLLSGLAQGFSFSILSVIFSSFLSVFLYGRLIRSGWFELTHNDGLLSSSLMLSLNNIIPMTLVLLAVGLIKWPLVFLGDQLITAFQAALSFAALEFTAISGFFIHLVLAQLSWFFGVHGPNIANDIFAILNIPRSTLETYFWTFAYIGGSGATLGLVLAILLFAKGSKYRLVAKFSLPFACFNINEIVIYGLPIVLNPIFLIPFLLVPTFNAIFSVFALQYGWIEIVNPDISWMLPPLLNIYQMSGGSWTAVGLQLLVIVFSVLCYAPFVVYAMSRDKKINHLFGLMHQDAGHYMREVHHDQSEQRFLDHQAKNKAFVSSIDRIFDQLNKGRFLLYFQPKFMVKSREMCGLEVLLRLHDRHGRIRSPQFIETLHEAGLSVALDRKVLHLVIHQIKVWEAQGRCVPVISINIDKPFLLDEQCLKELLNYSRQIRTTLQIEITEHSYISDVDQMLQTVRRLRQAGMQVSIDDFGAGYSSLTSLIHLNADEVKLDREFVLAWQRDPVAGQLLIQSTTTLCHQLGFRVVIEGVETAAQLQVMQACDIDVVQGYLTGKPMSAPEIEPLLEAQSTQQ